MILNRISSAIVVPLLHEKDVLGAIWLDSESLAQFQQKDLELVTAIGAQAAMFIENNLLAKKIEQEIVNRERFSRLLSPNVAERVLSGQLEVRWGDQLEETVTIGPGDMVYVPPRETHLLRNLSESEPAEYVVARDSPTEDSVEVPWAER